jgi:hypothetical protein
MTLIGDSLLNHLWFYELGVTERNFDRFIDRIDLQVDLIDQIFDRLNKGDRDAHMPI